MFGWDVFIKYCSKAFPHYFSALIYGKILSDYCPWRDILFFSPSTMEYSANMFNYENFPQQGGQTVHCEGVNLLFLKHIIISDLLTLDQANKHTVIFYNK